MRSGGPGRVSTPLERVCAAYRSRWGTMLLPIKPDGRPQGKSRAGCGRCRPGTACEEVRRRAIAEALRWGEPSLMLCPGGFLVWAIPLMTNARVTGGLLAIGRRWGREPNRPEALVEIRRAAQDLLAHAQEENLTNAAALRWNRERTARERGRAEAIHEAKQSAFSDLHTAYLNEEPALLSAVQSGDRAAARAAINRMLTGIYFYARGRLPLLRSFLLELVVRMSRAAVEAGAHAPEVLGGNYARLVELSDLEDEEQISGWLVGMLERLLDALRAAPRQPHEASIARAIAFMRDRLERPLSRADAARAAGMSPSHFSRAFREVTGGTFADALARMRCERACRLLARSAEPLAEVAFRCGFADQSYFTKVFKQYAGCTPRTYRLAQQRPLISGIATKPQD